MAGRRRIKLDFEKQQRLPEPRRTKKDEFEELTGRDELSETYAKDPLKEAQDILKGPSVKGFGGTRRTAEPYEKQKETEAEEESLKTPEYGVEKRKRRFGKRS